MLTYFSREPKAHPAAHIIDRLSPKPTITFCSGDYGATWAGLPEPTLTNLTKSEHLVGLFTFSSSSSLDFET